MSDQPTIGRVVHFVVINAPMSNLRGRIELAHRSARISRVDVTDDGRRYQVFLHVDIYPDNDVLPENSTLHRMDRTNGPVAIYGPVPQDEETKQPGTWHWPERE